MYKMKPYLNGTSGSSKSLCLKQAGRKMKIFYLLMAVVAMHIVTVGSGYASTLVIGNPPNGGNCFPLGCPTWAPQYQQVYARSDFSSPITISGLTFYNTLGEANNGFDTGTYSFSLSSTSKAVDGLDLSNLNNNIGANNTWYSAEPSRRVLSPSVAVRRLPSLHHSRMIQEVA